MAANDHIINKQVFEFECVHSEHAFQLQNKFDHDIQYKINRVIERACNRLADGGEDIRIPVLEIDLGTISFNRLESEILLEFEKQFYQKLLDQKNRLKTGSFFAQPKQTSLDTLKFFLHFGQLPWFAGKKEINIIDELLDDVLSGNTDEFRRFIFLNLGNVKFIERLINRNEQHHIHALIRILGIDNELILYAESIIKNLIGEIGLKINLPDKTQDTTHQLTAKHKAASDHPDDFLAFLINAQQQKDTAGILIRKLVLEIVLRMLSVRSDISDNEKFYAFFFIRRSLRNLNLMLRSLHR